MSESWWGIREVESGKVTRFSDWTEGDAILAANYNSKRWGPHELAPPVEEVLEGHDGD